MAHLRWTPRPVKVTIGDNRDYIRVLIYSPTADTRKGSTICKQRRGD